MRSSIGARGSRVAAAPGPLLSPCAPRWAPFSSGAAPAAPRTRLAPVRALESYMVDKLRAAEATFKELQMRMADPEVAGNATEFQKVARSAAELEATVEAFNSYQDTEKQLEETQAYLKELLNDPEMAEFTREEMVGLNTQLIALDAKLKLLLLPSDPMDEKNIMLEIRAGTGGDEASIWAGDIYRMYTRWA
jgi:peptide chain release factor 1